MNMNTKFAPADRKSANEIEDSYKIIEEEKYFKELFNSISAIAVVLNEDRQIIYVNKDFLEMYGIDSIEIILGKRTGETVSCIHAEEEDGGCGTSESCRYCGAIQAILESQKTKKKVKKEARITSIINNATVNFDLMITAAPLIYKNYYFTILTFQDISNEKRKINLEKIFFHDIINSASSVNGVLKLLKKMPDKNEGATLIDLSERASSDMIDDINSFRQLTMAEHGDLHVYFSEINSIEIIKESITRINYIAEANNKIVSMDEKSININIITDKSLLSRILINMLKNALEATVEGDFIKTGAMKIDDAHTRFWVKNNSIIEKEVQFQIFQRSYSTKAVNRGLGTYSIKLLGEKYLKGKTGFESNEKARTVFFIDLKNNHSFSK